MPVWIRERDVASATTDTPPPGSIAQSFVKRVSSATKALRGEQGKATTKAAEQTTLRGYFAKADEKDKTRTPLPWVSSLYTGNGHHGEKTDDSIATDSINKRKRSEEAAPKDNRQKRSRTDVHSPAPSFNLMSVFGQPPQSSLVLQPRTPPRRKGKTIGTKPAPAISPLKRRTLVVDSARDVAVQQHRQWQRSSSPLQAIDNVVGQRKTITTPRASTGLTPSKLRHGYSMIAFDAELGADTETIDCGQAQEEGASEEQDMPSSPSEERQERAAGSTPQLPFTRSPQSNKRIYALETQPDAVSPLQKHQAIRATKAPLADVNAGVEKKEKKRSLLSDSQPLSTPPASSPKASHARSEQSDDAQLRSSPTAAGGSFNFAERDDRAANMNESYMSEEEEKDSDERGGCGDETFRLPSSQDDFVTPIRPCEIKNKLRSNGKSPQKPGAIQREEEAQESGSETQPLSWNDDEDAVIPDLGRRVSQRVNASWADVGKVWMEVDLDQGAGAGDQETTGKDQQRQTSLHSFGFEANRRPKERKDVEVNRDIEFDSDEGVESDAEDDDDDDATQSLPWSDEDEEQGGVKSPALSLVPSEGDLDSQIRHFLDAV